METSMVQLQMEGAASFASLKGGVDRKNHPKAAREAWIYKETWQLADWRAALQRAG